MAVEVSEDILVPGDIIRFDYELLTDNETVRGMVISKIKAAIASDDRLDYQGSEMQRVGDLKLGRDVDILSVYAQVRKTRRETREEIQQASVSAIHVAIAAAVIGLATYIVERGATKLLSVASTGMQENIAAVAEGTTDTLKALLPVLLVAGLLYVLVLRK